MKTFELKVEGVTLTVIAGSHSSFYWNASEYAEAEIKPGDTYYAERNRGPRILTCKRVVNPGDLLPKSHFGSWIEPVEKFEYSYNFRECFKIVAMDGEEI